MLTITESVAADKNLSTMLIGIYAADLNTELSSAANFTVFAPSEMAFGKLLKGVWPFLLKSENKAELQALISNHIVKGKLPFSDLKDGQILKSITGKELKIGLAAGKLQINGATLQGRDQEASNGYLHSIDKVID